MLKALTLVAALIGISNSLYSIAIPVMSQPQEKTALVIPLADQQWKKDPKNFAPEREVALFMGDYRNEGPFAYKIRFQGNVAPVIFSGDFHYIVIAGSGIIHLKDRTGNPRDISLTPGAFVMVPGGVERSITVIEPLECCMWGVGPQTSTIP